MLDADGRWALLKLLTGGLRVGVSARLAKQALADLGGIDVAEIEEVWHSQRPPYGDLFAWLEKRSDKPSPDAPARFRPVMLAQAIDEATDFARYDAKDYAAEWKWDGIRVQAASERGEKRLYSRTGDDIGHAFPDVMAALNFEGVIDGELLVMRDGRIDSFGDLQQRLNRKNPDPKTVAKFPRRHPRLRSAARRHRGSACPALRRTPQAAGGIRRAAQILAHRSFAAATFRGLGPARCPARQPAGRRCQDRRRADAQAPGFCLRGGPAQGPVVQMEARPRISSTRC